MNARARTVRHLRAETEQPLFSALVLDAAPSDGLALADGSARLYRRFLSSEAARAVAGDVRASAAWLQERRVMYDRVVDVPREQCWFGDPGAWYRDGADAELAAVEAIARPGRARPAGVLPWTAELARVRDAVQDLTKARFAYVLVNRYRSGRDSVAWHSDRLHAALREPVIASLSLGATRAFDVRSKERPDEVTTIDLGDGDLLVMAGTMQQRYDHRVRKDPRIAGERLNLTFREAPGESA